MKVRIVRARAVQFCLRVDEVVGIFFHALEDFNSVSHAESALVFLEGFVAGDWVPLPHD